MFAFSKVLIIRFLTLALSLPRVLRYLTSSLSFRKIGWEKLIRTLLPSTPMIGICGGFEMMGSFLYDPNCIESHLTEISGFGFFDFIVRFKEDKKVSQVSYRPTADNRLKMLVKFQVMKFIVEKWSMEKMSLLFSLHREALKELFRSNLLSLEHLSMIFLKTGYLPVPSSTI
jgi:hypothetical protein